MEKIFQKQDFSLDLIWHAAKRKDTGTDSIQHDRLNQNNRFNLDESITRIDSVRIDANSLIDSLILI